jgi:threonine-phosphate decarboxylase
LQLSRATTNLDLNQPHGGDTHTYGGSVIDFSASINPIGVSEHVFTAISQAVYEIDEYPDPYCRSLTQAIADFEDVPAEYILCGNGSSELIYNTAFALKPKTALLISPCFSEYEKALRASGCEDIRYYCVTEETNFNLTLDFLDSLTEDIDITFLCNPNNPTAQLTSKPLLEKILNRCQSNGIFVVLDECFLDLTDEPFSQLTMKPCLSSYSNFAIIKAFTKTFALAGMRIGYALSSDASYLEKLNRVKQPWSVSTLAQVAGVAALYDKKYVVKSREYIKCERDYLTKNLAILGYDIYESHTNFIFFGVPDAGCLSAFLLEHKILVRDCSNFRSLQKNKFIRIAVKTEEENKTLIDSLRLFGD